MSSYRTFEMFEQEGVYDGEYKLTVDPHLVMKIINYGAAECEEELTDMENPKRFTIRVSIEVKEI